MYACENQFLYQHNTKIMLNIISHFGNNFYLLLLKLALYFIQEQYEFCHHVLADFLDGFDTYANFKEII